MNIYLQLKRNNNDPSHQEVLDIVAADKLPAGGIGDNTAGKFYFVIINGFPDVPNAKLKRWREKITERDYVGTGEFDPEDGTEIQELRNSRKWSVPVGALPAGARNTLRTTGMLTVTWTQAKPFVRRKLKKILRDDSQNNDNYVAADHESLTDDDVNNA